MFSTIRELSGPGIIENCVSAKFTKTRSSQLIIARQRVLDVFDLDETNGTLRAEASFRLFGVVESIYVVERYESESLDYLLLSFGSGRVSLVGYDESLGPNILRNIALYNFEPGALGSNLRMDTNGRVFANGFGGRAVCIGEPRCAAVMLANNQVGVIPLHMLTQDIEEDEDEEIIVADEEEMKTKLARAVKQIAMPTTDVWEMPAGCFLVDLCKLGIPQGSVIHAAFLRDQKGLPILAVLHHGLVRGSAGRLVVTRWTCQLTAVTISKHDATVVWVVKKLPHDAFSVIATDQGDVLVLSQNTVHFISGGVEKRTLEVNGFARVTSDVNRTGEDIKSNIEMNLDNVRWVWLDSNRLLLSLRHGQLALLDIMPNDLKLTLHALANQCTSMAVVGSSHIFLGSRLADSVLMQFKLVCEPYEDSNASTVFVDDEDVFLYGESRMMTAIDQRVTRCRTLVLRATDALPCTGPIAGMGISSHSADGLLLRRIKEKVIQLQARGMHSAAARLLKEAQEDSKTQRHPKEIVASAGRSRDGGVRVYCPSLRLDTDRHLICDIGLSAQAQSLWVVRNHMISNLWDVPSSYACQTISEMGDIADNSASLTFTSAKSLLIADIGYKWTVQVTLEEINVYDTENKLVNTFNEDGFRQAVIVDTFLLVITRNRQVKLFSVDSDTGRISVANEMTYAHHSPAPVSACCLNRIDGVLICGLVRGGLAEVGAGAFEVYDLNRHVLRFRSNQVLALGHRVVDHREPPANLEANHEGVLAKVKVASVCIGMVGRLEPDPHCNAHLVAPRLTVAIAFRNGDLLLYRVHDNWTRLYRIDNEVITRFDRSNSSYSSDANMQRQDQEAGDNAEAEEDDDRMVDEKEEEKDSQPRLKKMRSAKSENEDETAQTQENYLRRKNNPVFRNKPRLLTFDNFGGFCGMLFVNGQGTSAFILGTRGQVSVVRLDLDSFNVWDMTVQQNFVFILAATKKSLAANLVSHIIAFNSFKYMKHIRLDYGGNFPFVSIPLQVSVTRMIYYQPAECCIMLCSEDEGREELDLAVRENGSIRLLCSSSWEVDHQYSLMRYEKAVCINTVSIDMAPQNTTPRKFEEFIAVGTGFVSPQGEDAGCKGRILVFSVVPKSDDAAKTQLVLKHKIESMHIRGPITSITSVDGLLFATFGTTPASLRCFYYDTVSMALVDRSIYDTPFCGVEMSSVKNYILLGDLYRSVRLLHWHSLKKEIRLLAKDPQPLTVYSCRFLQSERNLGIIIADNDSNLHVMHFDAQKDLLEERGEISLATCATQLLPVQCTNDKALMLYGCIDGSVGALIPLQEQVFRRLFALQAAMTTSPVVARNAGLNPRAYRLTEYKTMLQRQRKRTIADGLLLWSYLLLDYASQRQLARLVGTTPETIYQDLLEIDNSIFGRAF